jgi:hypothetical protein
VAERACLQNQGQGRRGLDFDSNPLKKILNADRSLKLNNIEINAETLMLQKITY